MNRLLKIARSAVSGPGVQFCKNAYGTQGIRVFLRDVVAMANAAFEGNRYIFTGIEIDAKGNKRIHAIDREDFAGKPSYNSLVADFIEPPVRIKYQPLTFDGKRIGAFVIGDCQDRPYMMRIDHCEKLRRGDAYVRTNDVAVKMGRRQLQSMFEKKFRDAIPADNIEIGFPGEIIHKDLRIQTVDLSAMPSVVASAKLEQMLDIRNSVKNTGSTTVMARLTHARLFGSDSPYQDKSPEELILEMREMRKKHHNDDQHYLFEINACSVQMVVLNQGNAAIEDAALTLVMPNHNDFHVAKRLPKMPQDKGFVERGPAEQSSYPAVALKDDTIQVTSNIGDILPDSPTDVFGSPLRVCVGANLAGRKLGVRYSLSGKNLSRPAKGLLRLLF